MKPASNYYRHACFTGLILAVFAELALPIMGQVTAPARKVESTNAVASPLPVLAPATSGREAPTEPPAMHLFTRSFFVDPYQFHEVVRPKLPRSDEDNPDGAETYMALREWFTQLGVEMNQTNKNELGVNLSLPKTIYYDRPKGYLALCATCADLEIVEPEIVRLMRPIGALPR